MLFHSLIVSEDLASFYKYKIIITINNMKNNHIRNINATFNFENVIAQLVNFWIDSVMAFKHGDKIWLTIVVKTHENKRFKLINNLPFNKHDFSDIVVVLKQVFDTGILYNRTDKIDDMIFTYRVEIARDSWWSGYKYDLIFIFTLISTIILTMIIFYILFLACLFNLDIIDPANVNMNILDVIKNLDMDILEMDIKDAKDIKDSMCAYYEKYTAQICVFEPFIRLFNGTNGYNFYPSYFVANNCPVYEQDFNLLEYIIYNQYIILDDYSLRSSEYIKALNEILKEYQTITNRIL